MELNCVEIDLKEFMVKNYDDGRFVIIGCIVYFIGIKIYDGCFNC